VATRRHWAEVRKILEQDLLCDSLKGRIRYFATRYRKAHDEQGRVCVLVDDKEIINMPFTAENKIYEEVYKREETERDKSYADIHKEIKMEHAKQGLYHPGDFGSALDEFLTNSISDSINSENWIVRMLAILDRRVGKRTLIKIEPTLEHLPEWLQYFYKLRVESEKLIQSNYKKMGE